MMPGWRAQSGMWKQNKPGWHCSMGHCVPRGWVGGGPGKCCLESQQHVEEGGWSRALGPGPDLESQQQTEVGRWDGVPSALQ